MSSLKDLDDLPVTAAGNTPHVMHVGLDAEFDHPQKGNLPLAEHVIEAYEHDKEHAAIFRRDATGERYSASDMLNWFLLQSQSRVEDHLPAAAHGPAPGEVMVTFPIRFADERFSLESIEGWVPLSVLRLMVRVRTPPARH